MVNARLTLMYALALSMLTAPVIAESLNLPGLNVNLNIGPARANVNVPLPVVPKVVPNVNVNVQAVPRAIPNINLNVPVAVPVPIVTPRITPVPTFSVPHTVLPNVQVPRLTTPHEMNPLHVNVNTNIPVAVPVPKPTFVAPAESTAMRMPAGGDVQIEKGAHVLISRDGGKMRIQNLTGIGKSVRINVTDADGQKRLVTLDPGMELVAAKDVLNEEDVRIGDGVGRRNISVKGNIALSEIDIGSVLRSNSELRRLVVNPADRAERNLGNRLLKTAASLLAIRGGDGFEQAPLPPPPSNSLPPPAIATNPASVLAAETANAGNVPSSQTTVVSSAVNQNINTTTLAARTFDQVRPIINDSTEVRQRRQRQGPRRLAQLPVPLPAGPVTQTVNAPAPNTVIPLPSTSPKVLPNAAERKGVSTPREASRGYAVERARQSRHELQHPILHSVHSQLKQAVQKHPTLAILLIVLFGSLCLLSAALAVGVYKSRHEVNRLNRGLQAKIAELNELNDELTSTRDKALEASRLKSEFVANISHEIRTPITAVLGMIGLLKEKPHDDREMELVKMLDESARSLLTVINDILDFSKIEAGMLVIQSVDFRIVDVAKEAVELFAGVASEKGIKLRLNIDDDADRIVRGDPFRLRQVLLNLISNALKFTQEGTVSLIVKAEGSNFFGFYVRDTGIGISSDARKRLFQPFTQADGATTRRYGGTGLGLSICRRLVELMGGQIDFRSEQGIGSEFWFMLPFENAQSEPVAAPELAKPAGAVPENGISQRRILVAEDSPVLQRIVVHQLKNLNYDVTLVGNGLEAVEAIKNGQFDLVLMDWQMPELDGIQATKQIRTLAEGGTVPIIAMTANAMEGDRLSCLNAGMNDYISKPFTLEQLRKAIETWLPVSEDAL